MKSLLIYYNDAIRWGEFPELPYIKEMYLKHAAISPITDEKEIPTNPETHIKVFRCVYRKDFQIYVEI